MHLNRQNFDLYRKYHGDMDLRARMGSAAEKAAMSDADWYELSALLQQLQLLAEGRVSGDFAERIRARLSAATSDEQLQTGLLAYSIEGV